MKIIITFAAIRMHMAGIYDSVSLSGIIFIAL